MRIVVLVFLDPESFAFFFKTDRNALIDGQVFFAALFFALTGACGHANVRANGPVRANLGRLAIAALLLGLFAHTVGQGFASASVASSRSAPSMSLRGAPRSSNQRFRRDEAAKVRAKSDWGSRVPSRKDRAASNSLRSGASFTPR